MTLKRYRTLATGLPEVVEGSHMGNVDFRVRDKIFATLHPPRLSRGALKLTIEQQESLILLNLRVSHRPQASGAEKVGHSSSFSGLTAQLFVARSKWRGAIPHREVSPRNSERIEYTFPCHFARKSCPERKCCPGRSRMSRLDREISDYLTARSASRVL